MRKSEEAIFVTIGSVSLNLSRAFLRDGNPVLAKNYCGLYKKAIGLSGEIGSTNNLAKEIDFGSIVGLFAL